VSARSMGRQVVRYLIVQCVGECVVFSCSDSGLRDEVQTTGDVHLIHTEA
jgi:hypothetical protein